MYDDTVHQSINRLAFSPDLYNEGTISTSCCVSKKKIRRYVVLVNENKMQLKKVQNKIKLQFLLMKIKFRNTNCGIVIIIH